MGITDKTLSTLVCQCYSLGEHSTETLLASPLCPLLVFPSFHTSPLISCHLIPYVPHWCSGLAIEVGSDMVRLSGSSTNTLGYVTSPSRSIPISNFFLCSLILLRSLWNIAQIPLRVTVGFPTMIVQKSSIRFVLMVCSCSWLNFLSRF